MMAGWLPAETGHVPVVRRWSSGPDDDRPNTTTLCPLWQEGYIMNAISMTATKNQLRLCADVENYHTTDPHRMYYRWAAWALEKYIFTGRAGALWLEKFLAADPAALINAMAKAPFVGDDARLIARANKYLGYRLEA